MLRSATTATQEENITTSLPLHWKRSNQSAADPKDGADASAPVDDHPPSTREQVGGLYVEEYVSGTSPAAVLSIQHECNDEGSESSQPRQVTKNIFRCPSLSHSLSGL